MSGSLKLLAKRMRNIDKVLPDRVAKLTNDTAVQLVSDLTEHTPVDESTALSNWDVSYSFRPHSFLFPYVMGQQGSSKQASRAATIKNAKFALQGRKAGQTIYLSNNAPYIGDLARGTSNQAPSGWVENAVSRTRRFAGTLKSLLLKGL